MAAPVEIHNGAAVFHAQCARCHGAHGEGTDDYYPEPLAGDHSVAQLAALISQTMPEDRDEKLPADEARAVAEHIYDAFYSPEARARNKPARIELSRLTIRQHQNVVADLIASFSPPFEAASETGLRAQYYAGRHFRPRSLKLERIDQQVDFDFGTHSPDPEELEANDFSIRWEGSLLAPDTGEYEFTLRSEHAVRLWVNDLQQPLIDGWVRSGDDTEHRAEMRLIGGRAYPVKVEFSKSMQGVNRQSNKHSEPEVPAAISLAWRRPHHTSRAITARHLRPYSSPEVFVLQTPFPPDDRSLGYERGTAISQAWDEATTAAAIEVAGYVTDRLEQLAQADADDPASEPPLRDFCRQFAERAFRRPLSEEQAHLFIDRQFEAADDRQAAVKRVVLLVLKSPRFLYREVGTAQATDPHDVAARMSFGVWDSIPDDALRAAAAENALQSHEQIARHLKRMARDRRTRAKLREFLLSWLTIGDPPDLAKDAGQFPEFTPQVASDLRSSLELSIDELLAGEAADFRKLLLGSSVYLNGRLAAIYGVDLPEDAPFQPVVLEPEHRAGVVSHPYVLANLAYPSSSSPIHRGVFISRSLLGRVLRPPAESFSPLPPELHSDLTTRERVALQTAPQACQTCHSLINPLGFTLEHFDALGRYRDADGPRPVDVSGHYMTRSGDIAELHGARALAEFLVASEESQEAFVQQLFHHIVKQPIRAYGAERTGEIHQTFVENDFDIYHLLVEVVAASATPTTTVP